MSSPTPNCIVKANPGIIRLCYTGKFKEVPEGSVVRYIAKYNLPSGNNFGEYDESRWVAIYTKFGIGLISRYDLIWDYY